MSDRTTIPANAGRELREFVQTIPAPSIIRQRIEQTRREHDFLRDLLKLSLAAAVVSPAVDESPLHTA